MTDPGPYPLDAVRMILRPDAGVSPKSVSPQFYAELEREYDSFKGHSLVQTAEFSEDWSTWEVHPNGDELVYLLHGDVDFALWEKGKERIITVNTPGDVLIVPRGIWHTARPRALSKLLFITPGEGTVNAAQPETMVPR